MPEVMLRPNWPGNFTRTITERKTIASGKKKTLVEEVLRRVVFAPGQPVEVTDRELAALKPDLGKAIFEVERDAKGRPRLLEPQTEETQAPVPSAE